MILKQAYDIKIRKLYKSLELKKKLFKFLILNFSSNKLFLKKKIFFIYNFLIFQKKLLKISKTRLKNKCKITGRTQGVLTQYGISRLKLRELLQYGIVPGYSKAVW